MYIHDPVKPTCCAYKEGIRLSGGWQIASSKCPYGTWTWTFVGKYKYIM